MKRLSIVALVVACLGLGGCRRPPAVKFENLHLIASLRTACSAKSEAWLEGVDRAVQQRHQEGRMSDAEKAHFDKLIDQAKSGDWRGAEEQCFRFEQAQLSRTRTRPAAKDAHHDHAHPVPAHGGHEHDDAVHVAER